MVTDREGPLGAAEPGPGWFDDPHRRWKQRWFDGTNWTDHVTDGQAVGTDTVHRSAPPVPNTHPQPPARPAPAPASKGMSTGLKVFVTLTIVVVVGIVALLGLGTFLALQESESVIESEVDGATVVAVDAGTGNRTTWWVVVEPDTTDDELVDIATDLVSTSEAADTELLDVLFFDDDGRNLDRLIDITRELDELANEEDPDIDRVIELSSGFGTSWIQEHSLGNLAQSGGSAGERSYQLCTEALGLSCDAGTETTIAPE